MIAAAQAGYFVAIAAGNSSADATNYSPARVNAPSIYTPSAIDSKDVFARYSNWGKPVDSAEPGSSEIEAVEQRLLRHRGLAIMRAADRFDKRRRLMDDWAAYCCSGGAAGGNVTIRAHSSI